MRTHTNPNQNKSIVSFDLFFHTCTKKKIIVDDEGNRKRLLWIDSIVLHSLVDMSVNQSNVFLSKRVRNRTLLFLKTLIDRSIPCLIIFTLFKPSKFVKWKKPGFTFWVIDFLSWHTWVSYQYWTIDNRWLIYTVRK